MRAARRTEADLTRNLAGKMFLLVGALGLLAALSANVTSTTRAAALLGAVVDLALGALLLGNDEWPRTAAVVRSALGVLAAVALPLVARRDTEQVALVSLMKLFFFVGMLILLPGSAKKGRRWAGTMVALAPYFLLKILGTLQVAARTGFFDGPGEFLRVFFQMG